MALEKVITEDKIEIVGEYKHIQIRDKTSILDDGVEISSSYHRSVISPITKTPKVFDEDGNVTQEHTFVDTDISGESAEVQAICAVVHTDAVKAAYTAHLEAQETP
tara:strand:- start:39 stop:356 length:318 start_codon:yes stop_codon:yes gene_type:complete